MHTSLVHSLSRGIDDDEENLSGDDEDEKGDAEEEEEIDLEEDEFYDSTASEGKEEKDRDEL